MSKHISSPLSGISRRQFLYYSALAASATALPGFATAQPRRLSPNDKLNIGVVGAGGKGASDTDLLRRARTSSRCATWTRRPPPAPRSKYPKAKFYQDFRKMLEQEKSLDAVIVSTPDHMHAIVAAMAIRMGKHVYCQKPLDADDL